MPPSPGLQVTPDPTAPPDTRQDTPPPPALRVGVGYRVDVPLEDCPALQGTSLSHILYWNHIHIYVSGCSTIHWLVWLYFVEYRFYYKCWCALLHHICL
jgi:hypothetical protein